MTIIKGNFFYAKITYDCVVSGLTKNIKSLSNDELKDPKILADVQKSLFDYSEQKHSDVFYLFGQVNEIPANSFTKSILSLPDNIDFSGIKIWGFGNFIELESLPENIDLSNLLEIEAEFVSLHKLPSAIRFNKAMTWKKFHHAFSALPPSYNEQWLNNHKKA